MPRVKPTRPTPRIRMASMVSTRENPPLLCIAAHVLHADARCYRVNAQRQPKTFTVAQHNLRRICSSVGVKGECAPVALPFPADVEGNPFVQVSGPAGEVRQGSIAASFAFACCALNDKPPGIWVQNHTMHLL